MAKKIRAPGATKESAATKNPDEFLDAVAKEFLPMIEGGSWKSLEDAPAGQRILSQGRTLQAAIVRASLDRLEQLEPRISGFRSKLEGASVHNAHCVSGWYDLWQPRWVLYETLRCLLRRKLPLEENQIVRLLEWPINSSNGFSNFVYPLPGMASALENYAKENALSPRLQEVVQILIKKLRDNPQDKALRSVAERLAAVISGRPEIHIEAGEAWSDTALADLEKMTLEIRAAWHSLLLHCQAGGKTKITGNWQNQAKSLLTSVGFESLKDHALRWFPLVDKPRTQPIERLNAWSPDYNNLLKEPHVELLRGLAWCCGFQEDADLARALMRLAISAYRKIPGKGPRLVSLGNACVAALAMMPGQTPIGQLAVLKVKVKFGTAQKEIEKAFNATAEREGLPRDEIEELGVPTYGLESVGWLREALGDYQAEVAVDGSSAQLRWLKDGKPLKSAPAAIKKDHAEEVKELQAGVKDLNAMLPAQRERIDTLFLAQKTWPLNIWRERYLDHPVVGTIARRLVWTCTHKGKTRAGIWRDDGLVDSDDNPLTLEDAARVSLWHPIGRSLDDILSWRSWLERHEVVQPFKQAHREVYLLTDAERSTRTYSNRFAAHILRQHQYNALCLARGWKNKLRLMVDDSYPPTFRLLPGWNLRAEYWVEGAGQTYGEDTNEAGVFLHLATDQVRFYRIDAPQLEAHAGGGGYGAGRHVTPAPLPLDTIPPLVFSEIMRDVDLFVGVASVGNDPNWNDGGPDGRYRNYWEEYSFGELSATAQTRRALLERLIPRLKIAERCTLADRFLIVRGNLRAYKIHLGSGNILMTPNDLYLCIVPKQSTAGSDRVLLPFEGDNTLSVILSKAFLLADDTKITDPSIVNQIRQ